MDKFGVVAPGVTPPRHEEDSQGTAEEQQAKLASYEEQRLAEEAKKQTQKRRGTKH